MGRSPGHAGSAGIVFAVVVVAVLGAPACADLAPIQHGVCGNAVVEPGAGEDCDGFSDPAFGDRVSCQECRYVCATRDDCPSGSGCARDGICRHAVGVYEQAGDPVRVTGHELAPGDVDGDGRADVVGWDQRALWLLTAASDGHVRHACEAPILIAVGDPFLGSVNGDGRADLVAGGPRSMAVLAGSPAGRRRGRHAARRPARPGAARGRRHDGHDARRGAARRGPGRRRPGRPGVFDADGVHVWLAVPHDRMVTGSRGAPRSRSRPPASRP